MRTVLGDYRPNSTRIGQKGPRADISHVIRSRASLANKRFITLLKLPKSLVSDLAGSLGALPGPILNIVPAVEQSDSIDYSY